MIYDVGYKRRVREFYESLNAGYVRLYLFESVREYLRLFEAFSPRGRRVLDIGCGVGIGAGLASGVSKIYVCLDIACGVLKYPRGLPYVDVICADGELLPIRRGSIDLAILIDVINADGDGPGVLREALRLDAYLYATSPRESDRELVRRTLLGCERAIGIP